MDTIFLKGICVHAYHGCLPQEQTLGQRFILHVELDLDLSAAGRSDDLARSVNYAEVYATVCGIATQQRFNLLEALGEAIAAALLEQHARIIEVRVTIEKPAVPIAGAIDCAGVTLRRRRA